jgi:4-amino-4-deoxy-L-arabinose transferase-like glycosyltransferase
MRLPNLVLAVVDALLVWRVGRRFLPERQAQLAGLVLWIGPPTAVWFAVREQLFYPPTVTLGLVLALLALRIRRTGRLLDYAAAGLVVGLAVWTSANLVYYVLPAAVVALVRTGRPWRDRRHELLIGVPLAAATAVVGMLPWLVDNVRSNGAPLRAGGSFPVIGTYPGRFAYFFTDGLPGVLGFRETFTYRWVGGPVGFVAYLGVLAVLAWGVRRGLPRVGWDAVGFVVFPFVFASLPMVMDDPNLRYLFFVVPFVVLLLARVAGSTRVAVLVLAATLLVTGIGLQRIYAVSELEPSGYRVGNVGDLGPAIAELDRLGVDRVHGDYWVAYRLAFETEERIIATPSWGIDRYPPYTDAVRASPRSAWVVDAGAQRDALLAALARLGVPAEVRPAGEFTVVVPARPVTPEELPEAARRAGA